MLILNVDMLPVGWFISDTYQSWPYGTSALSAGLCCVAI